jgi:alkylation response protein AidB-like acyl-CoA dehydrogenase
MGLFPDATNRQRAAGRPERSIGRGEAAEASRTRPGTRTWTRTRIDDGRESGVRIWLELRAIAAGAGSTLAKPGSGGTTSRLAALADWAARDLSLARLLEGHVDALAILDEAGLEPESGAVYGVWASRPRGGGTTARLTPSGWHLTGTKPFCSGSTRLDRALVTAECDDGYRLFDISVAENVVRVHPGSWPAVGMADSLSDTLDFGGPPVPATRVVGPAGFYLERPGFWFGATGVAACWYGGARGLVGAVLRSVGPHPSELVVMELGHAVAHIDLMRRALQQAAGEIDADPTDLSGEAKRRALVVRHAVHHAAQEVLVHAAAAGGARPFCLDAEQARRVADLYVYLAQHHGPHDAYVLGAMACEGWPWS